MGIVDIQRACPKDVCQTQVGDSLLAERVISGCLVNLDKKALLSAGFLLEPLQNIVRR